MNTTSVKSRFSRNTLSHLNNRYFKYHTSLLSARSSSPSWNPQNTSQPLVVPTISFTADETVAVQLDALSKNDDPWPQHGIHTLYEFGLDIGGLDPSMYFGYPKDLYHLDHFQGQVQNQLPELINLKSYSIIKVEEVEDSWIVAVSVVPGVPPGNTKGNGGPSDGEVLYEFHLKKKNVGARKGALMTAMILKRS